MKSLAASYILNKDFQTRKRFPSPPTNRAKNGIYTRKIILTKTPMIKKLFVDVHEKSWGSSRVPDVLHETRTIEFCASCTRLTRHIE